MASHSKKPQPKMSPAQALSKAKRLALEGRIQIAESNKAKTLQPWIDKIVHAMGFRWAMITDESHISDCLPCGLVTPEKENRAEAVAEECHCLSGILGVPVDPHDTFVAVAQRIRKRESH